MLTIAEVLNMISHLTVRGRETPPSLKQSSDLSLQLLKSLPILGELSCRMLNYDISLFVCLFVFFIKNVDKS